MPAVGRCVCVCPTQLMLLLLPLTHIEQHAAFIHTTQRCGGLAHRESDLFLLYIVHDSKLIAKVVIILDFRLLI